MTDTPVKIVVDLSKPKGEREQIVPLTAEEIAANATMAAEAESQRLAAEIEQQHVADLKASAKAKLIAGEPLTAEEADTLVL